ncbi:MAG TPA: DUF4864 domain-containing protein [Allosphingosinicella sp.]|nr:DUF4864 domain-containing protein [Allosphingosinicella sp.]
MTDLSSTRPRRRFGLRKILLLVLGGLVIFGVGLFLILRAALGPVSEAADAFMSALRDGNEAQAFALAAPSLQQELGSAERMAASVGAYRPSSWSWSSRSVRNSDGRLSGSVTFQGGRTGTAEMSLVHDGEGWRVTGIRMN